MYHGLDISGWQWLEQYRMQPSEDDLKKNLVTRGQVVRTVAFQQCLQTALGYFWLGVGSGSIIQEDHAKHMRLIFERVGYGLSLLLGDYEGRRLWALYGSLITYTLYWWAIPAFRFILALIIMDTYQYFLHRTFHEIPFLYKHFHSMHHRLYVPFAFGSLYGHPFEGAILDGIGGGLSHSLAGLSERQAIFFFAFATYKTVDDHCGYYFPWHPIHALFGNNADYHDIHHQHAGIKSNYSQPLFVYWDAILGTRMTREELEEKKARTKAKILKSQ
ncbi:hypothetical protein Clacol_002067 [Clathrus columnatus]|uniref:Fatty acid hydroxylase domain-containing protein n=1 Tax=Clathrus columnatus TaxID=1419009 RepID=A0AAV4ZZQ8_9AGAM|nr:hypothetical protein Clacol_002067 [Clathrus columnatus]